MPVHTWAPADALEATIARLEGINTRESPISPVVLEPGQVSESPSFSFCRSGWDPGSAFLPQLQIMMLVPQADSVNR